MASPSRLGMIPYFGWKVTAEHLDRQKGAELGSWARDVAFGKSSARKWEKSGRKERDFDVGGTAKA